MTWSGLVRIWPGRLLFAGAIGVTHTHAHVAFQLVVAATGRFRLTDGSGRSSVGRAADLSEDGVQRLVMENTTVKQQRSARTTGGLTERLQGARDNNRFLDKRIADLEAQMIGGVAPELANHGERS